MTTSQQHRIQAYLEKHKIGALFEGLMLRLTRDTPDDPLTYLVESLKKKLGQSKQGLSTADTKHFIDPATGHRKAPDSLRRTVNDFWSALAVEAEGDPADVKRDYPKPWKTGTRHADAGNGSTKDGDHRPIEHSGGRPSWDSTVKLPTGRHLHVASAGAHGAVAGPSAGRKGALNGSSGASKLQGADRTGRAEVMANEADTLAEELSLGSSGRLTMIGDVPDHAADRNDRADIVPHRGVSRKQAADIRKEELRKAIMQELGALEGNESEAAVIESGQAQLHCRLNATEAWKRSEILDDGEASRNESSRVCASSPRQKESLDRQGQHQGSGVKISVCAVCARTIFAGDISGKSIVSSAEQTDASSNVTLRTHSATESAAPVVLKHLLHESSCDSEEEAFESVSQVSGPRVPVWNTPASGKQASSNGRANGGRLQASLLQRHHSSNAPFNTSQPPLNAEDLKTLPVSSQLNAYFAGKHSAVRQHDRGARQLLKEVVAEGAARGDAAGRPVTPSDEDYLSPFEGPRARGWRT